VTFDDLMRGGWADHEKDTVGVATRLEAGVGLVEGALQATKFAGLAAHAVGQHLGDWTRAARLCAAAAERAGSGKDAAPAWTSLAVARHLAGDVAGALAAETKAVALDPPEAAVTLARTRMLLAEGLAGAGRWAEAIGVFSSALDLVSNLGPKSPVARTVAVVGHNLAMALVEKPDRSEVESSAMQRAAMASRIYWLQVGDWRNDERADWDLATVANARGKYEEAAAFAERGLKTIAQNEPEPADSVFLYAALAVAMRGLGRPDEQARAIRAAERLAEGIEDADTRQFALGEVAKAR
jgi:tetratricopeptide (TPR) repeat protein